MTKYDYNWCKPDAELSTRTPAQARFNLTDAT